MQHIFIYTLEDPISAEIRYIGKTNNINIRFANHFRKEKISTHKGNWIKSLANRGLKPIIKILDKIPKDEWIFWEQHYISLFKSWGFRLTNLTLGGDGTDGFSHSIETIKKISNSQKGANNSFFGRLHSNKTKEKIGLKSKGRKHTTHTKEKCSAAKIGKLNPNYMKKPWNYGITGGKFTEETKFKMSSTRIREGTFKGEKNPNYGKCWIYNLALKENKIIKREIINNFLDDGWIEGRKIKF